MTLRNRISVAAAIGVLVVVAAVSIVLYGSYASNVHSRVDTALVNAAQQTSTIAQRIKLAAAAQKDPALAMSKLLTGGSIQVQLIPAPVVPGQSTRFGALTGRDVAVAGRSRPAYFAERNYHGLLFRTYTAAWADGSGLVRTSQAASADDAALRTAAVLLAALTVAAAALTYSLARLSAGRILRPIARLTTAAEHVAATHDLTARLGNTTADELGRLSAAFDAMLAALHDSVTAQRQLVADASHELRTPLTSLTTNLELLEDGAGLADPQAPALVRAAREQAAELDKLITDLLDLARYRESTPHRELVRLDLLTEAAVERLRPRLPQGAVHTDLRPTLVDVDAAAVDHAITNLVDNALKWNPAGAPVRVTVHDGQVSVSDHGPGIPQDDLPHIFERFYRSPAARSMPGSGLGLAIVGSVADANDGTVHVETGPHGSRFVLVFRPEPGAADTVDRQAQEAPYLDPPNDGKGSGETAQPAIA